jgi:hypothetical protein
VRHFNTPHLSVYGPNKGLQVTLPFDTSKPEARPNRVVFWTDDETHQWLANQATEYDLDLSLLLHRIVKATRQSTGDAPRRRASDAA